MTAAARSEVLVETMRASRALAIPVGVVVVMRYSWLSWNGLAVTGMRVVAALSVLAATSWCASSLVSGVMG